MLLKPAEIFSAYY